MSGVREDRQPGEFRLLRRMGSVGTGEVWLAHDPRVPRTIALFRGDATEVGQLTDYDMVRIGRDLAGALAHCDLEPPRVMICGRRVLLDASGLDGYTLGILLDEALSGKALGAGPRAPFAQRRPDLPNELALVIDRCLERRWSSPQELASALEHVLPRVTRMALPETPTRIPMLEIASEPVAAPASKRILIADDDPAIRRLFEMISRRAGVECDTAANGPDAIAALKENEYGVLFLDIMMPRIDGWGVLDYLRLHARQRPKVFIVTAFIDQMLSTADAEIVAGILYKPCDADELATLMRDAARGDKITASLHKTRHRLFAAAG